MLSKNGKQVLVLLSIFYLLTACGKENYHIGFPPKSSPGLSGYLAESFLRDSPLIEDGKTSIYTDEWRYYNGESVAYFYHTRSHVDFKRIKKNPRYI